MNTDYINRANQVIANTYKRFPVVFERGRGCTLWDTEGREYTDFVAGIAVCSLGHASPEISRALARQADTLFHVSNLFYSIPQIELAEKLTAKSFADKVFFCNSGAEANEAAIKLARKNFFDSGEYDRWRIVAMDQSFHGRSFATLSATGQKKVREGFEPILEGFDFVPFNDIEKLEAAVTENTCAVLAEPIQGEGGVRCPDQSFFKEVRELCTEKGVMLIFDEIQTGIGRTGKLFAYEHFGIEPDIMTLAKALGNGLPIGAMLAREEAVSAFTPGTHASTFGGTPVITAAALEVLKLIEQENILEYCNRTGGYFRERLLELKEKHRVVEEVRGIGLMLGMKLSKKGAPIVDACMERGFLINCTQENVLRFIPPLVISTEEIDSLIQCLDTVLPMLDTDKDT
ncbi:MAG: acetylornithine transaminase [Desulfobacterales bacterium]